MPLYNPSVFALRWQSTAEPELTGTGNNVAVQIYSTAGAFDTIPANTLRENDRVIYRAVWEVTQKDTATSMVPNLYWGGAATGQALFRTSTVVGSVTGVVVRGEVELTFRTVGASPVWNRVSEWWSSTNNTYEDFSTGFALSTIPTNAAITVEATMQITGAVTASDKVKLRSLRREIWRAAA